MTALVSADRRPDHFFTFKEILLARTRNRMPLKMLLATRNKHPDR